MQEHHVLWRTNFFRVKDRPAFDAWVRQFDEIAVTAVKEGTHFNFEWIALHQTPGANSKVPDVRGNPYTSDQPVDFFAEMAQHLHPEHTVVFMTIQYGDVIEPDELPGYYHSPQIRGWARALHPNGETFVIGLGDIWDQAFERWQTRCGPVGIPSPHEARNTDATVQDRASLM